MPIYFKEFEKTIKKWIKTTKKLSPMKDEVSDKTYKKFVKITKKRLILDLIIIFKQINIEDISIVPDLSVKDKYCIMIKPKYPIDFKAKL